MSEGNTPAEKPASHGSSGNKHRRPRHGRNKQKKNGKDSNDSNRGPNRNSKNRSRKNKKNNKNGNGRQLFLEIKKLTNEIKPITVNGKVVEDISESVNDHIHSLIEDKANEESIYLTFMIQPSDPDFPYDLDFLNVSLEIPQTYPKRAPSPTITVLNDEIPKGFSANIEIGFRQIVATVLHNRSAGKGSKKGNESNSDKQEEEIKVVGGNDLLGMMKTLDKYLEKFLSMKRRETVKIVKVIKKYDEDAKAQELEKKRRLGEKKRKKQLEAQAVDEESLKKRNEEVEKFKQRLQDSNLRIFKDNSKATVFKLDLAFQEESFSIEIENSKEITYDKLPVKLTVPKAYLSSLKKPLKLELDMSSQYNLKMMSSLEDQNSQVIFGKLINNMAANFDYMASDVAKINCGDNTNELRSITSQLNEFIENIQKFIGMRADFVKWYEDRKILNKKLLVEQQTDR
ncbi:hypothetical protein BRETT_000553 [Brettanomyces bruxellensis]|uniref:Uncharacterized protein n=1 Tax=Dekkera bruxellensis TaxID=5007 RepID=A0A871R4P4_DEKBR|nr:uncharacterized protein BRETT_000553 [Brettanomyces bruxellensis]QOU20839.1 hypothetical protein BRETT_000553 [Brettanomyces bruxellensis]